ncbi:MAG: sigma-70 family RNA polymerase sigma factor [Flavobacteriales bacterium]|nr:sigma-70 family RNA polymerase sigma factor [Flavobacteriales bacterium]
MTLLRRRISEASTDEELVARLIAGHRPALGALWDRYAHLLYGVGIKYLKDQERSKDTVVDLFASLDELLSRHVVKSFRPWVHTVMRNRCLMQLRSRSHERTVIEANVTDTSAADIEQAVSQEASLVALEAAIAELKEEQRTCIELFYLQHQSYQQIADATGFSLEQVRSHLQNGRRNLRQTIERGGRTTAQPHADQHEH